MQPRNCLRCHSACKFATRLLRLHQDLGAASCCRSKSHWVRDFPMQSMREDKLAVSGFKTVAFSRYQQDQRLSWIFQSPRDRISWLGCTSGCTAEQDTFPEPTSPLPRPFCQGSGGRPRCLLNCGLGTGGPVAHKLGQVSACSYSYSGGGGQI